MKRYPSKAFLMLLVLSLSTVLLWGQGAKKIYAQKLIDEMVRSHKELLVLGMHVTAPGAAQNIIIASNVPGIIGKVSDADDLKAVQTNQPVEEAQKDKGRYEVLTPLRDKGGKTIGVLAVVFSYGAGDDASKFLGRANHLRDELQKQIPSLKALFAAAR